MHCSSDMDMDPLRSDPSEEFHLNCLLPFVLFGSFGSSILVIFCFFQFFFFSFFFRFFFILPQIYYYYCTSATPSSVLCTICTQTLYYNGQYCLSSRAYLEYSFIVFMGRCTYKVCLFVCMNY